MENLRKLRERSAFVVDYNSDSDPTEVLDQRINVKVNATWFKGTVKRYDAMSKKHFVVFDDGDEMWLTWGSVQIVVLSNNNKSPALPPPSSSYFR